MNENGGLHPPTRPKRTAAPYRRNSRHYAYLSPTSGHSPIDLRGLTSWPPILAGLGCLCLPKSRAGWRVGGLVGKHRTVSVLGDTVVVRLVSCIYQEHRSRWALSAAQEFVHFWQYRRLQLV